MLTDILSMLPPGIPPELIAKLSLDQVAAVIDALPTKDRAMLYQFGARTSLAEYTRQLNLGIEPAQHHLLLIAHLEAVERGDIERLMVIMPPGSAKSTYASVLFPAWFLGRNPGSNVIAASHTSDLASSFGRRVRNIFDSAEHRGIFGLGVSTDNKSADSWSTDRGGTYFAVGVGGAVSGRRADLGLIDDPVKSREDADSDRMRDRAWEWYLNDFKTRLKPGGRQTLITCMTGDTPVLLPDGTERALRFIHPGDTVATYEDGGISTAKVLNWKNQGADFIYRIRMSSGITVRANERHPFLVAKDGELCWLRLRAMKAGTEIVRAISRGEHGQVLNAARPTVRSQLSARASACHTTTSTDGPLDIERRPSTPCLLGPPALNIDTASKRANISAYGISKTAVARFAEIPPERIPERTGAESCASITVTRLAKSEGFSATTVISSLGMGRARECSVPPLDMFDIALEQVVSIEPCGMEDVFDIEIEDTQNFIANGLVSHNTRWHEDDLAGRLLATEDERWKVLRLPMIAEAGDPLGRAPGERLWPDWFTPEMVEDAKRDVRVWNALYQGEPAAQDGDYFKRDWFQEDEEPPQKLAIYAASDYAVTEGGGDATEHGIFGVDAWSNVHLVDWWHGHTASDVWIEAQCDLILKYKPLCWFGEAGPIRRAIEPYLLRRMTERGAFCRIEWLPSTADKPTRCRAFQALAASGKVFVPAIASWKADVIGQLLRFPAGLHDDAVDVCSLLGRGLEHIRVPELVERQMQTRANVGYSRVKRYA